MAEVPLEEGLATGLTPPAPGNPNPSPSDVEGSIGYVPGTAPQIQAEQRQQQAAEAPPPLVKVQPDGEIPAPRPSLTDIFRSNEDDAYYKNTLAGTGSVRQLRDIAEDTSGSTVKSISLITGVEGKEEAARALAEIQARLIYGEVRPSSETPLELLVAGAGQIYGSMQSPEALLSAPIKLAGPIARGVERVAGAAGARIATIGVQNAAVGVALDPLIQANAIEAGIRGDYDAMDTLLAGPVGFAGGVAFGAGAEGLRAGARTSINAIRSRWKGSASPGAIDSASSVPSTLEGPEGAQVSNSASAPEVASAIEARRGGPVQDVAAARPGQADLESGGTYRFQVSELKTDPQAFQYKSGGDAEGVTNALRGVEQFDEAKAGRVIVWESNAGEMFVADGHQRTGLARRLQGEGKAPADQGITGLLYREADGYTSGDVMSIAAAANIATGTGTAIDAAKILRTRPDLINGTLPPNSQLVRDARGLSVLDDEAFGMVVNQVVPEKYGAQIGRAFTNQPEMQSVAMRAVVKADPANADELAVLIERIKAAAVEKAEASAQGGLFGDMFDSADSTVIEEMKIVGRALRSLKSDATLFKNAVAKADRLEASGGATVERNIVGGAAEEAARAAFLGEKAFDQQGPIRDALRTMAAEVKTGKRSLADAAKEFAQAVKRETGTSNQGEKINTPDPDTTSQPGEKIDMAQDGGPKYAGEPLPEKGVVPANMAADGTIYVGKKNGQHFLISEQFGDQVRQASNLQPGQATWKEIGFVNPQGEFLTREQAFAWVTANERADFKPSDNMQGELDALDYRDKVPDRMRSTGAPAPEPDLFGGQKIAALAVRTPQGARKISPKEFTPGIVDVKPGTPEASATWREMIARQPAKPIDDMMAGAKARQAELSAEAKRIADEIGAELKDPGAKNNRARIVEKMEEKGYRDTSQLTDLVRLGFAVNRPVDGDAILKALGQRFLTMDEGWKTYPASGFFDRKVMVQFEDGTIGEVQIWPKAMYEAKKIEGQDIYNRTRSAEARGENPVDLFAEAAALYRKAIDQAGPDWHEFYRHSEIGSGGRSLNEASNVSRETSRLSSTAVNDTGVQGSPSPSTANALPSEITAGRPSQDKNLAGMGETPDLQAAVAGLNNQVQRVDAGTPLVPTAPPAIDVESLRAINQRLTDALGLTVRQGRISARAPGGQVVGQFDNRSRIVRLREIDDFDVLSHEAGHAVEATIPEVAPLLRKNVNRRELGPLDYDPARGDISEGFAEFFRMYMTNRAAAQQAAPTFFAEFDTTLATSRPDMHADLQAAHDAWQTYLTAPSGQVVEANISTTFQPSLASWQGIKQAFRTIRNDGLRNSIANWMSDAYTTTIDNRNPIYKGVRALLAENKIRTGKTLDLKAADDPYKLARLSVDSFNAGHVDLMNGVVPYRGTDPAGPALREALVEALGAPNAFSGWDKAKAQAFDAYLISRRAVFEYGRYQRGEIPNAPTAETLGDHQTLIRERDATNPEFASAAAKVHEWTRNLLQKRFDAGLISRDQLDQALQIQDYVPFMRDMTDRTTVAGNGGGSGDLSHSGGLDRFRGSTRPIISPIESLMKSSYDVNVLIRQNDIVKALDRLALEAGPGAGKIVERIPDREMKATQVDPVEAIRNAARAAGVDPVDADAMVKSVSDLLGDDARASIFRLGEINTKGEPIVFFWDGGKRQALRLADGDFGVSMYQALTGMPEAFKDTWVNTVAKPSAILRAAITTSPDFLIANYFRDQVSAFILTENFVPFISGAKGIMNEVTQRDIARIYNSVGGIAGGANVASVHKARIESDFQALAKKGFIMERATSFEGAFKIAEASETGTRLAVFEAAYKRGQAEGLDPYEAAIEAAYQARDLIDFGRHGSRMMAAQRLIPFLNASMQGLDKAYRKMFEPALKHLNGKVLTIEDERDLGNSMKAWAKLSGLAMLSMALRAVYRDDPEYQDVSEYIRATHWVFKLPGNDKIFTVPKPFELAVPINLAERTYEYFAMKDPEAMMRFVKGAAEITSPPNALFSIPLIKIPLEVKANKNTFTNAPIVPDHMVGLAPFLQYTARTSALSKQIGEKLNLSPAVIDHVIVGFGGSWARGLLTAYDQATGDKGDRGWEDSFITRRFIKDVAKGSLSSQEFWKEVGQRTGKLEGQSQSYKALIDQGRNKQAADLLASLTEDQQVYVALNRSSFDADTKRLHPLRRARDAIQVLGDLRKEIVFNNVTGIEDKKALTLTPAKRRELDDAMAHVTMLEARNALTITKQSGWAQRDIIKTAPSYDVIRAISPDIADELQSRFAYSKVYTQAAVERTWPELKKRLAKDGSDAILSDLRGDVKSDGYELEGYRPKKAKSVYTVPGRSTAK